ncbi:MAG TPA: UDP-N-acetylmuramyl pentapeptide phosphotransferase [Microbacteriaceae bacterium]|nr:UDP-N-acetylmuramyl pentapeptide phosphotransferase [Microbacteriaceae bacterium]
MSALTSNAAPSTGAQAVVENAMDPARRPDVLFRVRRDAGQMRSAWWSIGAFVLVSGSIVALMSLVPGGH